MNIPQLPRFRLATLPTPLHDAPRLTAALGGPRILFKRDDLTGLALGGNKARKLEFLLADALAQQADILVTGGGPQSNHVRMTAAAARIAGMDAVGVIYPSGKGETQGNLLLDHLLGLEIIRLPPTPHAQVEAFMLDTCERLRQAGRRPYYIPLGGSVPLADTGYVLCALELQQQCLEIGVSPSHIILPTGSCGTHAGLLAGVKWLQAPYRVLGMTVSRAREEVQSRLERLTQETADLLGLRIDLTADDIIIHDAYRGPGYAISTPEGEAAIRLVATTEGIFLDPVYTGKAMAGLIDLIRRGALTREHTVVFLHTGGVPGLFAYDKELGH